MPQVGYSHEKKAAAEALTSTAALECAGTIGTLAIGILLISHICHAARH
jgi:hypothetical protein